ncbi:hypothetical protein [Flavobacterium subsaxonicum]|uniref:Uncharacterized protein n=1 Tax=Flavobacterium subsaxonicum WB 4.1-42 = DSM 21790 TaxID=1121898 RepID=A0A0A2MM46_9FLAO|nr:hypothetical protein [Flavobacterium subsaxonicum]KGO93692.1 hypothetical protein Q766_06960 [Flavobacterium subsaxonicum WB 4.1-42 = DSM 21790]
MKKLYLWAFVLPLLNSCSVDSQTDVPDQATTTTSASTLFTSKITGHYPENSANAFDDTGQLYYQISEAYFDAPHGSYTTSQIVTDVESIANANIDFLDLKPTNYAAITVTGVDAIADNNLTLTSAINNSGMSQPAKNSLLAFINGVMDLNDQEEEFDDIYQYTIIYETAVIANASFNTTDKQTILTTTSLVRYAFYFASTHKKKPPRDRDWEIGVGNIVGAIKGAEESTAKAVTLSAAVGIRHNND